MNNILAVHPSCAGPAECAQSGDVATWSDASLIATVRRDPPDEQALDLLVDRYWKPLFGRCQMLTLNHERARDLAQEAWCRVLRARRSLKPDGNLAAYLTTVATNLWRDSHRSARRAGPLAEHRMASLDAELPGDDGGTAALADVLPDLNTLQIEEQVLLKLDIDRALAQLTPLLRDVLVARFLTGESCAEIGRRYGRTEQTVSGWVREGMQEMRVHLEEHDSVSR
jgi:RNA polymerase sigma factor (sigma-70 family)